MCSDTEAKANFFTFPLSSVAGKAPTKDPSNINKNIHGNKIASGYSNDTDEPIDVATNRCKKYL